ncbi:MAG: hypothetical protein F4Z31_20825 [Gemmatimonadetes bacterium]|nr:hypothetical protein [Gemmatimonadota bacterium]
MAKAATAIKAAIEDQEAARQARDEAILRAMAGGASREAVAEAADLTTRQIHRIEQGALD